MGRKNKVVKTGFVSSFDKRLTNAIMQAYPPEEIIKDEKFRETVEAQIFGRKIENPKRIAPSFLMRLFKHHLEIKKSLIYLENVNKYLKIRPSDQILKSVGLNRSEYFQYHYENYLNEAFIMRERVRGLFDLIEKRIRKEPKSLNSLMAGRKRFLDSMDKYSNPRNSHVHSQRLENDVLEKMGTIELLMDIFEKDNGKVNRRFPEYRYYLYLSRQFEKTIKNWIGNSQKEMKVYMAQACKELIPIVFSKTQGFRLN